MDNQTEVVERTTTLHERTEEIIRQMLPKKDPKKKATDPLNLMLTFLVPFVTGDKLHSALASVSEEQLRSAITDIRDKLIPYLLNGNENPHKE